MQRWLVLQLETGWKHDVLRFLFSLMNSHIGSFIVFAPLKHFSFDVYPYRHWIYCEGVRAPGDHDHAACTRSRGRRVAAGDWGR